MPKRLIFVTIFIMCFFLTMTQAQEKKTTIPHSAAQLACEECHVCKNPTAADPCLRTCPRHWKGTEAGRKLTLAEGPDVVILNELEKLYEPVRFTHKAHAAMAEMGQGCVACHHYTPTNAAHPSCKECHSPSIVQETMTKPGLKGAYHRQCMGCHKEWTGETNCEICHASKAQKQAKGSDYVAPHYRPCKEPDKKVYTTSNSLGPYVTFFHTNHTQMYGLKCNDCHKNDPCVSCHYQGERPVSVVEASADVMHHKCGACHNVMAQSGCTKCHSKTERKGFDHGQATGWALNIYHQKLSCNSCHPANKPFSKLNRSCNSCHSKWALGTFNHQIVGLALDETHAEMECTDCHADRRFDLKPSCSGCHDDKTYPKDKPGKVTQKGK